MSNSLGQSKLAKDRASIDIDALKEHFGVDLDGQLADALGLHKTTIANWRQRGGVPSRHRLLLTKRPERPRYLSVTVTCLTEAAARRLLDHLAEQIEAGAIQFGGSNPAPERAAS
ncbi:hypothetical protein [Rhodoplanes sp. SY1]|uniref:hypothetical protein n=1 Tax=Rhodoplanes sp. SY1 TaxID=3166646 RepID=UPI0038B445A4